LIDNRLGKRPLQSTFSYTDVIKNVWLLFLAEGDCAEDIQEHLWSNFLQIPKLKVSSPDTIGRVLKNLQQEKQTHTSRLGVEHQFSNHDKLNTLNLDMLLKTKSLCSGSSPVFVAHSIYSFFMFVIVLNSF
jgi:hypothetical protein